MTFTKKAVVHFDDHQYKKLKEYAKSQNLPVGKVIRDSVEKVLSVVPVEENSDSDDLSITSFKKEPAFWDEGDISIVGGNAGEYFLINENQRLHVCQKQRLLS